MGTMNQYYFLESVAHHLPKVSRVLEVGSFNPGSNQNFRNNFPGVEYIGVDIQPGEGVDVVCDFGSKTFYNERLHGSQFDLCICCSVLEHSRKPWNIAESITEAVRPGGFAYISVPWVWRYHEYPSDYWRFSPECVKSLFSEFDVVEMQYSTTRKKEFIQLKGESPNGLDNALSIELRHGSEDKYIRKYLPYLNIEFLGRKKDG